MHPETEQLLGTLELLCSNPFIWENTTQEEFSLWNLMTSEGFVNLTYVELAFEHWQNIEEWGTPTNQAKFGEYAPTRSERKKDDWNDTIAKERKSYYQQILDTISANFHNLQAYNLSIPRIKQQNIEWEHPSFYVSIVVAQTPAQNWLCLAPTTPNQVTYYFHYGYDGNKRFLYFSDSAIA